MNNSYVIQWKSKTNGRAGKGTKVFNRDDAEDLTAELNYEYPDIEHEAVGLDTPPGNAADPQSESAASAHEETDYETTAEAEQPRQRQKAEQMPVFSE